jgi:OOP family OmpA-OmpF porin
MRLLRITLPCLGLVIAMAGAGNALAQQRTQPYDSPWYIGAGLGVSWYDTKDQDFNSVPGVAGTGMDKTGLGWKLFGGYRFSPYFGLEGSYVDLGSSQGVANFTAQSYNAAFVGRVPLGKGFSLQGKVGAAFTRAQGFGNTHYQTNPLLGAGFGYDFPNGATVLAEYEYFGRVGNETSVDPTTGAVAGTGRANAHLFSVSTLFRF